MGIDSLRGSLVVMCHNGHPFEPGVSVDHAPSESDPRWCDVCGEARAELVTASPKPRCQFGRPHVWVLGFYQGDTFIEDHAKCATCGQIEEER